MRPEILKESEDLIILRLFVFSLPFLVFLDLSQGRIKGQFEGRSYPNLSKYVLSHIRKIFQNLYIERG